MPKIKKLSTTAPLVSTPCAQLFLPCRLPEESCWAGSRPHTPMPQPPWHHLAPKSSWKFVYQTNSRFKTSSVLSKSDRHVQKWKSFSSFCNLTPLHDVCVISTQFFFLAAVILLGFFLSPTRSCSPNQEPWFVASLPLQKGEERPGLYICADLRCMANIGTTRSQQDCMRKQFQAASGLKGV